jgi:hypothetical protein
MAFAPSIASTWFAEINSYDSSTLDWTWTSHNHPHLTEFASNFAYIRTVSRGIRVVNVSTLLNRGGAIYVSYGTSDHLSTQLTQLRMAEETEVYDLARLTQEGLSAIFIPMTNSVMFYGGYVTPVASTYIDPSVSTHAHDTVIYIWAEGVTGQDMCLEFEEVHNWEAIPFSQNEFLFERKAVMSSDDAKAAAMQCIPPTRSVTTTGDGGHSSGFSSFLRSVKKIGLGALDEVGKIALGQVETLAKGAVGAIAGLFGDDLQNHRAAWHLGYGRFSPKVCPEACGKSRVEFLQWLFNRVLAEQQDAARQVQPDIGAPRGRDTPNIAPVPRPFRSP